MRYMEFENWFWSNPAVCIVYFALLAFSLVCLWRLFEKAGIEGWWAIIPFANSYQAFKLFCGNGWLFLLMLIPYVNIAVSIYYAYMLCKSFGHGVGFTIGLIFLSPIFKGILAFNKDEYIGPSGVKGN